MKFFPGATITACALWLSATAAFARPPRPSAPPPPPSAAAKPVHPQSLEQAVKQVQHQTRGHILAADSVARGHNQVYRIKVLTPQGQVKVMQLHSSPRSRPTAGNHDSDQGGH